MKNNQRTVPTAPRRGLPGWTCALLAAGALTFSAQAQVQKAGDLLVSVDATGLALGSVTSVPNKGTLGGVFGATGTEADRPAVQLVGGTKALNFDGTDFLQLEDAVGGSLITAPASITGPNPTHSIEVWTLNPNVAGEETLVSWGHRGGPDGSNVSFGYGSDFRWGAMGHWGAPDLGWNNDGGNPAPNKWHHLVYTYDETTSRVYADGKLTNAEILGPDVLNTHPDTAINIANQLEADGVTPTGGLRYTGAIARVRIHDGVLSPEQVLANYNLEKGDFVDPAPPPPIVAARLTKGPIHRYSFSETAAANATDAEFKDSVGTAHGKVQGDGAAFSGSRLVLAGGPSGTAAFGDLPNGIISSNSTNNGGSGEVSIETWMKVTGARTWSRVFDIGSSTSETDNEVTGPGGGGTGLDYLELSAQIGDDTGSRRLEIRNEDPANGGIVTSDSSTKTFGKDFQVLVTWKESTGRIVLYENGLEIASLTTDDPMSDLHDVNVWLGRSNWNGDQNTQGEYDEFRIYNTALTPQQALGNALAGPDLINDHDVAATITQQPSNQTIPETLSATFSVASLGSTPITIQWYRNDVAIPGATGSSYTIPAVSAADNNAKFTAKVSNGSGATAVTVASAPATLIVVSDTVTLKHRYSFSETSGTSVKDSVGTANGTLNGTGTLGGGQLALDGTDGYVNLPNGIISSLGDNGTIEAWFTYDGGPAWSRMFDFGSQVDGEDGTGNGQDYLFFTPKTGDGMPRFIANFPNGGDSTVVSTPGSTPIGEQMHLAITYSFTGSTVRVFTNGTEVVVGSTTKRLSELTGDVNNWLGKSQFPADPSFKGKYNEFRIYQGALTPAQVTASFAAGPDSLPVVTKPIEVTATRQGRQSPDITVTWTGGAGPFLVQTSPVLGTWIDTVTTSDRSVTLPLVGGAGFIRVLDGATKTVQLFKAHLDAAQEPNKPASTATGLGLAIIEGQNLTYYVSYEGLTTGLTASHIHNGAVGVAGPVSIGFTPLVGSFSGIISGTATLTADQKTAIVSGGSYFNIHTTQFGGGEIRGQILP